MNHGGVKSRNLAAAAIIAVALVACGRPTGVVDPADHSTPTPTTPGTTTLPPTPTLGVVPEDFVAEPGSLAYRFSNSGQTYLLSLLQRSSQQVSPGSSPEVLGLVPPDYDLTEEATGRVTYEAGVSAGEDVILTVAPELEDVTTDGEVTSIEEDGIVINILDAVETMLFTPEAFTTTLNQQGEIIEAPPQDLGWFPHTYLPKAILANPFHRQAGPSFPDRDLSVGDTWDTNEPVSLMTETIDAESTHEVLSIDQGGSVVVLRSVSEIPAFTIDLTEIYLTFFSDTMRDATPAELELWKEFSFLVEVAPTSSTATTRFDKDRGMVLEQITEGVVIAQIVTSQPENGVLVRSTYDLKVDGRYEILLVDD
jgi:hypothetical protein